MAAQLAASQEGLSSMKLVISFSHECYFIYLIHGGGFHSSELRGSIPGRDRDFSFCNRIQTDSAAHTAPYSMDLGNCFPTVNVPCPHTVEIKIMWS
jgi:hypothetical protein